MKRWQIGLVWMFALAIGVAGFVTTGWIAAHEQAQQQQGFAAGSETVIKAVTAGKPFTVNRPDSTPLACECVCK